jgi:hypothetical protein
MQWATRLRILVAELAKSSGVLRRPEVLATSWRLRLQLSIALRNGIIHGATFLSDSWEKLSVLRWGYGAKDISKRCGLNSLAQFVNLAQLLLHWLACIHPVSCQPNRDQCRRCDE